MTDPSEWQAIGNHKVRVEDDLVFSCWASPGTLAEIQAYHGILERVIAEKGRVFCLIDMANTHHPPPEARQWLTEWSRRFHIDAIAGFRASFAVRVASTLILRAIRFFKGSALIMEFFETEAEARAFLAAERARLAARNA
jgi:hypothetical protein